MICSEGVEFGKRTLVERRIELRERERKRERKSKRERERERQVLKTQLYSTDL